MNEWKNPYADLQTVLRSELKNALHRTNGCVTRDEFIACASPGREEKAERVMLRLLKELPDGKLEWKPEIVVQEILAKKLDGSLAVDAEQVVRLWQRSRMLPLRTSYPYIAPAGKKSQLVSRTDFRSSPVFGADILVRPPTPFSEEREENDLRNDLVLGNECFSLVVHGTFDEGCLMADGEYFARLVIGDDLSIPRVATLIGPAAWKCETAIRDPLMAGDPYEAVRAVVPHMNEFAESVSLAFIN